MFQRDMNSVPTPRHSWKVCTLRPNTGGGDHRPEGCEGLAHSEGRTILIGARSLLTQQAKQGSHEIDSVQDKTLPHKIRAPRKMDTKGIRMGDRG